LDSRYPGLAERLIEDGALRRFVNVYLNDEDVRFLDGLKTPVTATDSVTILPAVAGG
jgi:molybdopterin converting factor small subunit